MKKQRRLAILLTSWQGDEERGEGESRLGAEWWVISEVEGVGERRGEGRSMDDR